LKYVQLQVAFTHSSPPFIK